MRPRPKFEIAYGMLALALIYVLVTNNVSITGFVIGPPQSVTLTSPSDNAQTRAESIYFMFQYPPEMEMKECTIFINNMAMKTATAMLKPSDTRIRMDMVPGVYDWKIQCTANDGTKIESSIRRLAVLGTETSDLKVIKLATGYIYQFELKDGLNLQIGNVVPNDAISVKRGSNTYNLNILRVVKDYSFDIQYVEMLITPGDKRIKLNTGDSVELDFNNDGENDMKLSLDEISYNKAFFTVRTKTEDSASSLSSKSASPPTVTVNSAPGANANQQAPSKPSTTQPKAEGDGLGFLEIFLISFVILLVIAIIIMAKSRQKEEKEYVSALGNKTGAKEQKPAPKKKAKEK
jgi:hypothetical protein